MNPLPRVLVAGVEDAKAKMAAIENLHKARHAIATCDGTNTLHVLEHDPSIAAVVTCDERLLHQLRGHPRIMRFRAHPVVVIAEEASVADKGRVSILPLAQMLSHAELGQLPAVLNALLHPPY